MAEHRRPPFLSAAGEAGPPLDATLDAFARAVRDALGDDALAIYIFGSLVQGDFEPASSDIDFLVVTRVLAREDQASRLVLCHADLAETAPWGNRLEGGYAAVTALRPWGIEGDILSIEPHGPLNLHVPSDYTAENMVAIRDFGYALFGPPAVDVLPPVDDQTFRAALETYRDDLLRDLRTLEAAEDVTAISAGLLTTVVLDLARCLYGLHAGRPCTKREAVAWLCAERPDLTPALDGALTLRQNPTDQRTLAAVHQALPALRRRVVSQPRT